MKKILLKIPVRELHNDLVSTDLSIGLPGVHDLSGNILISDTKLILMLPKHLQMMSDHYEIMCVYVKAVYRCITFIKVKIILLVK
jgi:hypothetical protein